MSRPVFLSYAGIDQLLIATVEDLERLETLDKARWAATSLPCEQFFADPVLLDLLDTDHNGRIRVDEMKAERRWLWERLRVREGVIAGSDTILLAHLDPDHPDAKQIRALAERLLRALGVSPQDRISLEQVRSFKASYLAQMPNGDGVVTQAQIPEADVAAFAHAVLATPGGATDLSGAPGVRAEDIDAYLERIGAYAAWCARKERDAEILSPLGPDTPAAVALIEGLTPKIAQFFAQCALVALEPGAVVRLQATPEDLAKLDVTSPADIVRWLETAPLARPTPEGRLPLQGATNPHFAAALDVIARDVGPRALGREAPLDSLSAADWAALQAVFEPGEAHQADRPVGIPADADPAALLAQASPEVVARLRALAAEDAGVAAELREFNDLEHLALSQRWLLQIANNMVSFPDLFAPTRRALFEAGTLILDGRRINLCMRVMNRAEHRKLAETSNMFVAYLELVRKDGDAEVREAVAAAVTAGMRGGISVGKRGVFYDREDREWDATVVEVIVAPISLLEAILAPFTRLRAYVAARFSSLAEAEADALQARAASGARIAADHGSAAALQAPPAPAKTSGGGSSLQGLVVGGSVAFAAIGSSLAFVVKTVADIDPLHALVVCSGLVLAFVVIFGLLGWLRLRRRDVSALLEASGWALNGRMRLTHTLSQVFTVKPGLPRGAVRRILVTSGCGGLWLLLLLVLLGGLVATVVAHPRWLHPEGTSLEAAPETSP